MTSDLKKRVGFMRNKGKSYAAIAEVLSLSENTVKSCCRRNGFGAKSNADKPPECEDICPNCSRTLIHTPGAKKKRFCSDQCRMAWWAKNPEAMNRRAVYHYMCPVCGLDFESYGNAHRKYCSRTCFGAARRSAHE